jgi:hypothetical protein
MQQQMFRWVAVTTISIPGLDDKTRRAEPFSVHLLPGMDGGIRQRFAQGHFYFQLFPREALGFLS